MKINKNGHKFTLLQSFEISTGAYAIWNVIKEAESRGFQVENALEKCRSLLKLKLSDGENEVNAMEYTRIPALNLLTPIGTQVTFLFFIRDSAHSDLIL